MKIVLGLVTFVVLLTPPLLGINASEDTRIQLLMLTDVTTGSAELQDNIGNQCRESAVYLIWGTGVSAGGFTVESSYVAGYAGTWAPTVVVPWTAANKQDIVQITGVHKIIRVRVSTTIVGGTASAYFVCN